MRSFARPDVPRFAPGQSPSLRSNLAVASAASSTRPSCCDREMDMKTGITCRALSCMLLLSATGSAWTGERTSASETTKVIDIGDRRELFVDEFLIEKREGLELRLQTPVPRE